MKITTKTEEAMKRKYFAPEAELVNIRLSGSVLETGEMTGDSEYSNEWGAKEQELEWEEEAAPTLPRNINLWEE